MAFFVFDMVILAILAYDDFFVYFSYRIRALYEHFKLIQYQSFGGVSNLLLRVFEQKAATWFCTYTLIFLLVTLDVDAFRPLSHFIST